MYQIDPPLSPQEALPTMYDLPSENQDERGLPDKFHLFHSDGGFAPLLRLLSL